jgi:CheY-specific phosphatase CheX
VTSRLLIQRRSTHRWLLLAGVVALLFGVAGAQHASAAATDYAGTFYLSSTASTQVTGSYQLVQTAPTMLSSTTQNRIKLSASGYQDFEPGVGPGILDNKPTAPVASASTTPTDKGWIVDGAGGVTFAAGTWTFTNTAKSGASTNGSAQIVVAMWKVTVSGNAVNTATLLVDPNCTASPCSSGAAPGSATAGAAGSNFITSGGTMVTQTLSASLPAISLASDEHLYVQYWRWQTTAYTSGGSTVRLGTLGVNDGVAAIAHPDVIPSVTLGSVASRTNAPSLAATYADDAYSRNGTVTQQLCTDSGCSSVAASSTSGTLAPGAAATWSPGGLTTGTTYYWRAQSTDSSSVASGWTPTTSFVYDNSAPGLPALSSPAGGTRVNSAQLSATYANTDAGDSGTVDFQLCSVPACTTPVASWSSSNLTNGATATWTPSVADGPYYWRARDSDVAGNQSSWTAARSFTLDTTAPSVATGTTGALLTATPALTASFSDPDAGDTGTVSLQLCSDSACSSVLQTASASPWTPSGLGSGTYYWQARAQDAAGNQSSWSTPQSFQLDVTAPTVTLGSTPPHRLQSVPQLSATFADAEAADTGTVTIQLCATSACTTVLQSSTSASGLANGATNSWTPASVADGTYYWRARAQDAAGNLSSWSPASSFVVDTVPPSTPPLVSPAAAARVTSVALGATFSDPDAGDTGTVAYELCSDPACSTVLQTSATPTGLADGTYYWRARATDDAGNQSAWSATRAVTLDTTAPSVPATGGPADGAYLNAAPALSGTFADPDPGDTGSVTLELCSDSACTTPVQTHVGSPWTPSGLAGTYYWRAQATDAAGNVSAWSPTHSFTVDSTPPDVPVLVAPSDTFRGAKAPTLDARYGESAGAGGSITFDLCRGAECSTKTLPGLLDGDDATWAVGPLDDGTYTWRARATDTAGNASAWSAQWTFTVDSTPPTVALTGAPARTNVAPVLHVHLSDAGGSARALVEVCADAACTSVAGSGWTPSGSDVSWTPPALADGTYWWRALGEDVVGNQSAWSAGSAFVVDTVPPAAPSNSGPATKAAVNRVALSATIPGDASDRGRVEFEICGDANCRDVILDTSVAAGASGSATSTPTLADGAYTWRARSVDVAGNVSDWTPMSSFTVDRTPPGEPRAAGSMVTHQTLILHWQAPKSTVVARYVLLVNGRAVRSLPPTTRTLRIKLKHHDRRSFAVAAVDGAGNVGAAAPLFGAQHVAAKQAHTK